MSSKVLYPCIIDSYMPAFVASDNCRIYFSLSKFNGARNFKTVHVSIMDQATGRNVLNTNNPNAATGILINVGFNMGDEDNSYFIEIRNSDLEQGWVADRIYKVQLRLSNAEWNGVDDQAAWLNSHSDDFSEWSTVCILKAISKINYAFPILGIDTSTENQGSVIEEINTYYSSTLTLAGSFVREIDSTELVNYYSFALYDSNNRLLESSGNIYTNKYSNTDSITYIFKTELKHNQNYNLAFKFTTINGYEGGFYYFDDNRDERFHFTCSIYGIDRPLCKLISIENDVRAELSDKPPEHYHQKYSINGTIVEDPNDSPGWIVVHSERFLPYFRNGALVFTENPYTKVAPLVMEDIVGTSIFKEEEEGRVILKVINANGDQVRSGNYCIRRADSRDNFQTWTDIYMYVAKNIDIDNFPLIYDYTIESGIWYKYGIQIVESNGDRGELEVITNPIMRNFNYSFLLGKDNQQLKLKFDNTMPNFKYQIYDSKTDPIGAKFTSIARNANTYYKTFPINGLISFNMDEAELFCNKRVIYNYTDIIELYKNYNTDNGIEQYDYIYEREFRNKVLEFLQDGEFKLFKSPTEGNIIIRLTEVSCVPNQTLGRLIYSFSATASEMDEPTMENYKTYGFYTVAPYESSFATYEVKLGQITGLISTGSRTNIFTLIQNKYGNGKFNIAGHSKLVTKVHHMKITFNDKPLLVNNGAGKAIGYKFRIRGNDITVLNPQRVYEFDNRLVYDASADNFYLYGDDGEQQQKVTSVDVTIDFLYELETDIYRPKDIQSRSIRQSIGQIYQYCTPNENLYRTIYYKYYIDWDDQFIKMNNLSSIIIEANPGAMFEIQDAGGESSGELHVVGATGLLELFDMENIIAIRYLGMKDLITGTEYRIADDPRSCTDVMLTYICTITKGIYKQTAKN